jgi:hypothetical protein
VWRLGLIVRRLEIVCMAAKVSLYGGLSVFAWWLELLCMAA